MQCCFMMHKCKLLDFFSFANNNLRSLIFATPQHFLISLIYNV